MDPTNTKIRARNDAHMSPLEDSTQTSAADGAQLGSMGEVQMRAQGRHASAVGVLEAAVEPIVEDMGYELLLLEWLGGGKRRVMRLYIDKVGNEGVSIDDCSRMSRIVGNTLDAQEAAAEAGEAEIDPALLGLLRSPYVLEVSSPGIDRPLTKLRHFEEQLGGRVKLETYAPLEPSCFTPAPPPERAASERKFDGRVTAVEADTHAPLDPRRGLIVLDDAVGKRTIRVPLPRVRRANLVWEG